METVKPSKFRFTRKQLYAIGNRRVHRLAEEYRKLGLLVVTNPTNHEGPDLILISSPDGRIVKVMESTNYARPEEYVCSETFKRYLDGLNYFDSILGIEKVIVVSFRTNLLRTQWQKCRENGITVEVVGRQD